MAEGIAIVIINDKKNERCSKRESQATFTDRNLFDFDNDLTSIVDTRLGFECIYLKDDHDNDEELNSNQEDGEDTQENLTAHSYDKTEQVDEKTETTEHFNTNGKGTNGEDSNAALEVLYFEEITYNRDLSVDDLAHPTGIKDPKECGCLRCKVRVKAGKSKAKYFLCAISSHGVEIDGQMSILFSDEKFFSLNDIIEIFSDKFCPELKGKVKIFIIQACRSDPRMKLEDKGVEVQIAKDRADSKQTGSVETRVDLVDLEDSPETGQISIATGSIPPNTLLIFSCWSGRPSYRTEDARPADYKAMIGEDEEIDGSWMIREMKKVFNKEEGTINFLNTLTKVAAAVAERETGDGCKSTMTIVHTLTQPIYLKLRDPDISDDELDLGQANIN